MRINKFIYISIRIGFGSIQELIILKMMNKLFVLASLFAGSFASKNDFPSFDALHANCEMTVTYKGQDCATVLTALEAKVKTLTPDP